VADDGDEERGVLDSLVDDKATAGAHKPLDDVHKARALGADGGVEERLECPVHELPGVSMWRSGGEAGVPTERRRPGVEAEGKPELLRSIDGVRWAVSWRARRTPRAKKTCLARRLGDDERAEGSADGAYS
jgi:hypothetical protein